MGTHEKRGNNGPRAFGVTSEVKIIDRDLGWAAIKRMFQGEHEHYTDVGIMQEHDTRSDSATNIELGFIHEFGAGKIPERSFLRSTINEKGAKYTPELDKIATRSVMRKRFNIADLAALGKKAVADVQAKIMSNIPPPLAAETVANKGHDLALIDTRQMFESIDHREDG
jgi:hypothetical protein